jgi:hypothetical protein
LAGGAANIDDLIRPAAGIDLGSLRVESILPRLSPSEGLTGPIASKPIEVGGDRFIRVAQSSLPWNFKVGDSAVSSGQLEVDFASDQVGDRDEIAQ